MAKFGMWIVLLAAAAAMAAVPQSVTQPSATSEPSATTAAATAPGDPTQMAPSMRSMLGLVASTRPADKTPLPRMVVRGLVDVDGRSAEALLEIDGTMYSVRKGSSLAITTSGGRSLTLQFTKVCAEGIEIESSSSQKATIR